jgi:hypothetical protein
MTSLRTIAAVLIFAIAVQPVAALGIPCCCKQVEATAQKACCQHQQHAAKPAAKPCCAKHVAEGPKLRRGCCCSVESGPANLPAQERLAKVSFEQLFTTPALLPTIFAVAPRPELHAAPLLIGAAPPSVNVLHCTWQI